MTIKYVKHDLTATTRGIVAHGCNCQGKMGSGVAKAVRAKWPHVYKKYARLVSKVADKEQLLGDTLFVNANDDNSTELFVANCFTQLYYGYDGKAYADAHAVLNCLDDCLQFAIGMKLPLYIPRIGCGLGGLSWENDILPKLEMMYNEFKVTNPELEVFVCDL